MSCHCLFLVILLVGSIGPGAAQTVIPVRLVGGGDVASQGRVEVFNDERWGTVCNVQFDISEAAVVCRQLGYTGSVSVVSDSSRFGPGNFVWLDAMDCTGSEDSISKCTLGNWGSQIAGCDGNARDVGVICTPNAPTPPPTTTQSTTIPPPTAPPVTARPVSGTITQILNCNPDSNVQLVDGPTNSSGRVQVRRNNQWGTVCDDRFGVEEARVVCRMLCYPTAQAKPFQNAAIIGGGTGPIWLDDLKCVGNEARLDECPEPNWGTNDCSHREDAGVACGPLNINAIPAPEPSLTCNNGIFTATFDRTSNTALNTRHYWVKNLAQNPANCVVGRQLQNNNIIVTVPLTADCLTTMESNSTHIIYKNMLVQLSTDTGTSATINKVPDYDVPIYCVLPRELSSNRNFEPQAATVTPLITTDLFAMGMQLYTDSTFTTPLIPPQVILGEYVYASVQLTTFDTDRLKVIVPNCTATPTAAWPSDPNYPLIQDKCSSDNTLQFFPLNETMLGLSFQSFRFLQQGSNRVYIHCEAFVCEINEKNQECDRSCSQNGRKKRSPVVTREREREVYHLSNGPVLIMEHAITRQAKNEEETADRQDLVSSAPSSWVSFILHTAVVTICALLFS